MSLQLVDLALLTALAFSVVGAIGAVVSRRTIYAAFYLSVVGVGIATFMTILGYTYLGLFHLLIYVGAAVSFLAFTVLMVEVEQEPPPRHSPLLALLAVTIAAVLVYPLFLVTPPHVERMGIDLGVFVNELSERFEYPVVITLIALAAVLIEAIAVARRSSEP
ncbi:NADH-ubiquinone/plastoquinone oxidoreductase chain 6 [Pyrolobus fumarii 1A]|uniref:NADH-ubiquinone/plastoquinone oxidoreductase chain 6 n=1 Tax=Pyrolobus fumarii (strain DSM 11204 / 1A) TaxID=694429 RepID=G0ED53_PYRF1|nr:NADH-quinone oxidoreductase subunit J [Pyrolobus fumarii]AEM39731.1 NADH-ubiquinone/plastoquinone oxidoreductase chain 6 [Pyrolobus fumarii 1A]